MLDPSTKEIIRQNNPTLFFTTFLLTTRVCLLHVRLRAIDVFTPPAGLITYPGLRQIARIIRYHEPLKPDPKVTEKEHKADPPTDTDTASIITSLDADTASPEDQLRYNRGHGRVENRNHRPEDMFFDIFFGEDTCPIRTGNGPANRASLNTLAMTVILTNRRPHDGFATAKRRL